MVSKVAFLLASLMILSQARGQVHFTVTMRTGLNGGGTTVTSTTYNSDPPADIRVPSSVHTILIAGVTASDNIGNVYFTEGPSSGSRIDVILGGTSSFFNDSAGTIGANDCGRLSFEALAADVAFTGHIQGNLTSLVSGIDILYRVDVDGSLGPLGSIRQTGSSTAPQGVAVVEAGSMAIGSSVGVATGTLVRVRTVGNMAGSVYAGDINATANITSVVVGGNFTGTVSVPTGTLGSMAVTGDIILPVPEESSPQVFTPRIYARNSIGSISARSIKGVISTVYDGSGNGGSGTLTSLTTARDMLGNGGSFRGFLVSQGFANAGGSNPSLNIDGDFGGDTPARVFLRSSAVANKPVNIRGRFLNGSVLSFGNSMPSSVTIGGNPNRTSGQELQGQILVNARSFANETTGTWTGPVRVGGSSGTLLGPANTVPNYTNTATSIGGGAVGVFPYRLHDSACDPPNASTLPPSSIVDPSVPRPDTRVFLSSELAHSAGRNPQHSVTPRNIVLEWYGPVFDVPSTGNSVAPVAIFLANDLGQPTSEDWSRSFEFDSYEVRQSTSNIGEGFNRRIVFHSKPELLSGRYVVLPRRDDSGNIVSPQCNGINTLPGTSVPVAPFRYDFYVASDCDRDGVDDAYQIQQDWSMDILPWGTPPGDHLLDYCQCDLRMDYNVDGNNDQGDIDYLINVIAGGDNPGHVPPDFNYDGNTDQGDIDALLNAIAGGGCP